MRELYYALESSNYELNLGRENLEAEYHQLDNLHSYSVDQVAVLTNDNSYLYSQQEALNREILHLKNLLKKADLLKDTLTEENEILSREKRSYSNNIAISSQENTTLRNICDRLERDLRVSQNALRTLQESSLLEKNSLKSQIEELQQLSDAEKNKFILNRMALTDKIEQLNNQYTQLELSNTTLAKENKSLRSREKKFKSRMKGNSGDTFDGHMNSLQDIQASLVQSLVSQKEGSCRVFSLFLICNSYPLAFYL